jgi:hypothetical protein
MHVTLPDPKCSLVVILGASVFPRSPGLADGPAFYNSASRVSGYLTSAVGLGLDKANILNLFDDSRSPGDQLEDFASFLNDRQGSGAPSQRPENLFIYYVGHGLFTPPPDRRYCLAVRSTNASNPGISTIRGSDLAEVVTENATFLRRFFILDCCFAAAMYKEFLTAPSEAVRAQLLDEVPPRGTTLLCASSHKDVALAPKGLECTMFSDALLKALAQGNRTLGPRMSLSELGGLVKKVLRTEYPSDWVRPEVHSPGQREGDIAAIPLFPNPAWVSVGVHGTGSPSIGVESTADPHAAESDKAEPEVPPSLSSAPKEADGVEVQEGTSVELRHDETLHPLDEVTTLADGAVVASPSGERVASPEGETALAAAASRTVNQGTDTPVDTAPAQVHDPMDTSSIEKPALSVLPLAGKAKAELPILSKSQEGTSAQPPAVGGIKSKPATTSTPPSYVGSKSKAGWGFLWLLALSVLHPWDAFKHTNQGWQLNAEWRLRSPWQTSSGQSPKTDVPNFDILKQPKTVIPDDSALKKYSGSLGGTDLLKKSDLPKGSDLTTLPKTEPESTPLDPLTHYTLGKSVPLNDYLATLPPSVLDFSKQSAQKVRTAGGDLYKVKIHWSVVSASKIQVGFLNTAAGAPHDFSNALDELFRMRTICDPCKSEDTYEGTFAVPHANVLTFILTATGNGKTTEQKLKVPVNQLH